MAAYWSYATLCSTSTYLWTTTSLLSMSTSHHSSDGYKPSAYLCHLSQGECLSVSLSLSFSDTTTITTRVDYHPISYLLFEQGLFAVYHSGEVEEVCGLHLYPILHPHNSVLPLLPGIYWLHCVCMYEGRKEGRYIDDGCRINDLASWSDDKW